ncbi:MAG: hypothetical protein EOO14_10745 [Chitinophagaceae bacterium]|nr:MAG: hypothetical protein EOO14_10745 [Chitinophagaceae bacterium]
MLRTIKTAIILMLLISLFACRKSSTETTIDKDDPKEHKTRLIGSWKLSAQVTDTPYDFDGDGTNDTDLFAMYSSCGRDQGFVFNADATGSRKFACQPVRLTTWKIFSHSDSIAFSMSSNNGQTFTDGGKVELVNVTSSQLVLRYKMKMLQSPVLQLTDTYVKQ